jgi:hypothetical protein
MAIWDYSVQQITTRLDCRQFQFLTLSSAERHLQTLVELYRARQQETTHELPFESLYERLLPAVQRSASAEAFEAGDLRRALNQLETYGNVAMRLEPRRVRRIADRGLKLLLVRLTEGTHTILGHLESQLEQIEQAAASSARFSLLEVDDALQAAASLLNGSTDVGEEQCRRAARDIFRARRAVEEAAEDLLQRDLWLTETAVQTPDQRRLADLLVHLETYFERYLYDVDRRRLHCFEILERLLDERAAPLVAVVQDATSREFAEDPTRAGRRPPEIHGILRVIQEFLRPGGILDSRRLAVHQRLADVAGHLKRYLAELVRRSQLVAALRRLSCSMLRASDDRLHSLDLDEFLLRLWQPAHAVLDETSGVPNEKAVPARPYYCRPSNRRRFLGATIRPFENGRPRSSRPLLIKQMEDLNAFVDRVILRGDNESLVSDAVLDDMSHARLLVAAVRMARLDRSRLRRRYLKYSVTQPTVGKQVVVATRDGSGRLHLPQLIFSREGTK